MSTGSQSTITTKVLMFIEVATIVAGLVASVVVVVTNHHPAHASNPAGGALQPPEVAILRMPSACDGAKGTHAMLQAYLDGAELPAHPSKSEPAIDAALRVRGAELFAQYCATCHGERGDGTGPTSARLAHRPANFTTGTYELRTTEHEALPTDADVFRTITRGVHGTAMPPWFVLPERDRWALVAHLKTLSSQFEEDEAPPPVDVRPPPVTRERLERGAQIYAKGGCASCHGDSGRGDGPAASSLVYKSGGPAHPRDLTHGRFHRGTRLPDIYLTIVTGFDGTPMASFAKVLSPDELWDVAMFVHSLTPRMVEVAPGLECPRPPLPTNADEVVGVQTLIDSVHPST